MFHLHSKVIQTTRPCKQSLRKGWANTFWGQAVIQMGASGYMPFFDNQVLQE